MESTSTDCPVCHGDEVVMYVELANYPVVPCHRCFPTNMEAQRTEVQLNDLKIEKARKLA